MNHHYLTHTDPFFAELKIVKFIDEHKFTIALYMFKHRDCFVCTDADPRLTRNSSASVPTFQRLAVSQRSLSKQPKAKVP